MADQKVNELPAKASPVTGDKMLVIGAAEESLIDYDQLADAILNKLINKTFTLDQGTKTLLAALNELNSKTNIIDGNNGFGTGATKYKDFMRISIVDRYSETNRTAYFLKPADSKEWDNVPNDMPRNVDVYGIREVFYCTQDLILVKITECYPVSGRQYFNVYRGSNFSWGMWYTINPI